MSRLNCTLLCTLLKRAILVVVVSTLLTGTTTFTGMVMAADSTAKKVTVEIWTPWTGTEGKLFEQIIADFETLHPDIDVVHNYLSYSDRQKLVVAYAAGNAPDVAAIYQGDMFRSLQDSGVLAPLDGYMKRTGVTTKAFFPSMVEMYKVSGQYWALPHAAVAMGGWVTYNKSLFREKGLAERVPDTWDELLRASRHLTAQSDDTLMRIPMQWTAPNELMLVNLMTSKAPWLGEDGKSVQFDLPEVRSTLQFATDYTRQVYGSWKAYNSFISSSKNSGCDISFFKGQVAMYSSHITVALRNCGVDMEYGLGLLPRNGAVDYTGSRLLATPGWSLAVSKNKDSAVEYASYLLTEYLTADPNGGGRFMLEQGRLSPIIKVNLNSRYYEVDPDWGLQLQEMSQAVWLPSLANGDKLRGVFGQMFNRAVQDVMSEDQNIAQATADWRSMQAKK